MSTTNGSGEPSMEEILASIRNIIAQDPPAENSDEPGPGEVGAASANIGAPVASSGVGRTGSRVGSTGTFSDLSVAGGANIDLRASAAAALLPPEPEPSSAKSVSAPVSISPAGTSSVTSNGSPEAVRPVADDFSDVFEEPLKALSMATRRGGQAEAGAKGGGEQGGEPEPRHSSGNSGQQPATANAEPTLPRLDSAPPAAMGSPAAQRKEFDFGSLRAPPRDDITTDFANSALPERDKSVAKEAEQSPEGVFERLTTTGAMPAARQDEEGEAPRRKVVIASMPAASSAPCVPSGPAPAAAAEPEVADSEGLSADGAEPVLPTGDEGGGSAKTSNVGFLASASRLSDAGGLSKTEFAGPADGALKNGSHFEAVDAKSDEAEPEVACEANASEASVANETGDNDAPDAADVSGPEMVELAEGAEVAAQERTALASAESVAQALTAADVVVSSQGGNVRTLEDTVSELLRPLLREWLENNMPRIVENALRLEVADSVKKQLQGSSDKPDGIG